ncbi:hypothetical protein HXX76_012076 [Chlamydomonas incerta]|uniref:DNA methyltransferase n=1 Tax=Chlamydomonas incerta TaxID=51695 RepID=A0A835VWJ4_CHLIN|nr:hypothetical protein HXX76_012076 [Chlamydomonas incerta]|eukprot:KAG2427751.1 hypothetical protein HXX76_012076 [Chlamydomonas incerta]
MAAAGDTAAPATGGHAAADHTGAAPAPALAEVTASSSSGAAGGGVVRILDLYSGVGCLHAALARPGVLPPGCAAVQVAAAVDINTAANAVYAAEHGAQPRALDLTRVTAAQLDALAADVWLLTPPCQPYTTTTNARRKDIADPRAASLLHLAAVLPAMRRPPARLLLENVPGFGGSDSAGVLVAALAGCGYRLQQFLVSPHQLGLPYSRPRYFALAVRAPLRFIRDYDCAAGPVPHPPLLTPQRRAAHPAAAAGEEEEEEEALERRWAGVYDAGPSPAGSHSGGGSSASPDGRVPGPRRPSATPVHTPAPLSLFLQSAGGPAPATLAAAAIATAANSEGGPQEQLQQRLQEPCASNATAGAGGEAAACTDSGAGAGAGGGEDPWLAHAVPAALLGRFWRVLDVVTPAATYSNCFTKHYADNALAAGSVLATPQFAAAYCRRDPRGRLHFLLPPPLPPRLGVTVAPAKPRRQRRQEGEAGRGAGGGGGAHGAGTGAGIAPAAAPPTAPPPPVPIAFRLRPKQGRRQGGPRQSVSGRKHGRASDDEDEDEEDCRGQTSAPAPGQAQEQAQEQEQELEAVVVGLRFFSPEEVAALHGLPAGWAARAAAAGVGGARQQYALLGNGLSVDVAAHLLTYLFAASEEQEQEQEAEQEQGQGGKQEQGREREVGEAEKRKA